MLAILVAPMVVLLAVPSRLLAAVFVALLAWPVYGGALMAADEDGRLGLALLDATLIVTLFAVPAFAIVLVRRHFSSSPARESAT